MQLDPREHFLEIVSPAIDDYEHAEVELTEAVKSGDQAVIRALGFRALRLGGSATIFLHHFADIVANRPPLGAPDFGANVLAVRQWLADNGAADLAVLGDAADSLKHAVLTHRLPREVEEADQVLVVSRGYGTGRYGEGKFGGIEQVWVLARSGQRPLSVVLDGVRAVWRNLLFGRLE